MNDSDGEYAPGEPIFTGALQAGLSGDRATALSHMRTARGLLGALRAAHGVDARLAAGEPGGFFQRYVQAEDGTRIIVTTNNGHNTVRIDAPVAQVIPDVPATVPQQVLSTAPALVGPHHFDDIVFPMSPVPAPEGVSFSNEEAQEKELTADYTPYLWIGVRFVKKQDPNNPEHSVHACLWEPAVGAAEPLILSNRNSAAFFAEAPFPGNPVYPLGLWTQFSPVDDYTGIACTDRHLYMLLQANGYPMRIPDYTPGKDEDIEWDVIFISDYQNDMHLVGTGGEPMSGTGIGDYYLKVMVTGADCETEAGQHYPPQRGSYPEPEDMEVMVITGRDEYRVTARRGFRISEFTRCDQGVLPFGFFPRFDPQAIHDPHDRNCDGTNPHGPHWWQGMAKVTMAPLQIAVPPQQLMLSAIHISKEGEVEVPPTGFEVGNWPDQCVFHPQKLYKQSWIGNFYGLFFSDDPDRVPFNHWQYTVDDYLARYSVRWDSGGYLPMELGQFVELLKWTYIGEPVIEGDFSPGPNVEPHPNGGIELVPY
jgi:hypothetical protein